MVKGLLRWFRGYPAWSSACAGAGLGVMSNVMTNHWLSAPAWVLSLFFWVGLLLFLVPIPTILLWTKLYQGDRNIYRIFLVLLYWIFLFISLRAAERRWSNPPQADLALCFLNPNNPELEVVNLSDDVSAEGGQFTARIYDIDSPSPEDPLNIAFLPTVFSLRPKVHTIPITFFPPGSIKSGDRIAGSIGLTCPKCKTGRTYWLSVIFGTEGWYSQIKGETDGGAMIFSQWVPPGTHGQSIANAIYKIVQKTPENERIHMQSIGMPITLPNGQTRQFDWNDCAGIKRK